MDISRDGQMLVTGAVDGSILITDLAAVRLSHQFDLQTAYELSLQPLVKRAFTVEEGFRQVLIGFIRRIRAFPLK
jgi:hypothetical protein